MQENYSVGTIEQILEQAQLIPGENQYTQSLQVKSTDGTQYAITVGDEFSPLTEPQLKAVGDKVITYSVESQPGEFTTVIADAYRLPTIAWLSLLFVIVVIGVGRKKGLLSIIGMAVSLLVLLQFIIPQILLGANPILISLFGSLLIGSATVYLSHGYNLKSHIALFSMMASLVVVAILSFISVKTAFMFGLGSEEAAFLQVGSTSNINLQGLLLGGIMLGALGVLDDVTVSQVSLVFQLRAAKKTISFIELYNRSIAVGRDHVASLVNTLVLAYAGANMPLFLLFTLNDAVPTWVTLNSEIIVEEVIRTLTGSIGLVLAVPLTTVIAAYFAMRLKKSELEKLDQLEHSGHAHTH